jgi:hypothetical protein
MAHLGCALFHRKSPRRPPTFGRRESSSPRQVLTRAGDRSKVRNPETTRARSGTAFGLCARPESAWMTNYLFFLAVERTSPGQIGGQSDPLARKLPQQAKLGLHPSGLGVRGEIFAPRRNPPKKTIFNIKTSKKSLTATMQRRSRKTLWLFSMRQVKRFSRSLLLRKPGPNHGVLVGNIQNESGVLLCLILFVRV